MTILARRPRKGSEAFPSEYVLIDRGEDRHPRYVSAVTSPNLEANKVVAHGRYFADRAEAMKHFETREG